MNKMKKILFSICLFFIFTLSACSSDELADGEYKVNILLEGGSGKASLTSPTDMIVENRTAYVSIEWSSPNYDYMIVDGKKYEPVNDYGNSVFEIPVAVFDEPFYVIADTTAMSTSHEINYQITVSLDEIKATADTENVSESKTSFEIPDRLGELLVWKEKLEILYATGFSVDYYEDENNKAVYKLLTIYDDAQYLVLPENAEVPKGISKDIAVIKSADSIYLAASQVMDMFDALDEVGRIRFCALKEKDWYIDSAKMRLKKGDMLYAGKYSAPDYELIISKGCNLVIENTMIYHTPQVKEKLESFGMPVIVDRSSYESEPLGRIEWVKLYGAITDKEEEAAAEFDKQLEEFHSIRELSDNSNKPVIAFFYISSNGSIKVRKSNDYLPKMIAMAGGEYVFPNLGENETGNSSTMNMQMEEFYATAKDADYIIYNSTVDGELSDISELIEKNELLANFKAVKNNRVYCTSANLYQSSMELGTMIKDINSMITGEDDMTYLYRLQ